LGWRNYRAFKKSTLLGEPTLETKKERKFKTSCSRGMKEGGNVSKYREQKEQGLPSTAMEVAIEGGKTLEKKEGKAKRSRRSAR